MEIQGSIGGLIPLWILCAPLVVGLIALVSTPKTTTRHDTDIRSAYTSAAVTGQR